MSWTSSDFKHKREAWNKQYTKSGVGPRAATLEFAIPILERQTDAAIARIERTDTKAALVIPAIGVVFGIVSPLVPTSALQRPGVPTLFLGLATATAIACALLAVVTIWPRPRSVGPEVDQVMTGSAEELADARWDYFKSMGFSAQSSDELALSKARWLGRCLAAGAASIVCFVVFAALGGLQP